MSMIRWLWLCWCDDENDVDDGDDDYVDRDGVDDLMIIIIILTLVMVLMMMTIMLMAIKMTACNDEEPAPSVRSCILLLHRNHRAPLNLCHSEPSSFLYLTLIKLKHASVEELRNHYWTIKSNKVPPCKSTHQGRAPPWQHRPTQNIDNLKLKKINIDVKIRTNPRLEKLTWMQSLCPSPLILCSFGRPLVREAKSSPNED